MFSSLTSHSRAPFPFQMRALISQGLPMMHCGSHWATLTLKHKLISRSIPPRTNRRPSTCFLSRFCLFLFPPLVSHFVTPIPHFAFCTLRCWNAPVRVHGTVRIRVRCIIIFESVCTGRMRRFALEGVKQQEPSASAGDSGNFFFGQWDAAVIHEDAQMNQACF